MQERYPGDVFKRVPEDRPSQGSEDMGKSKRTSILSARSTSQSSGSVLELLEGEESKRQNAADALQRKLSDRIDQKAMTVGVNRAGSFTPGNMGGIEMEERTSSSEYSATSNVKRQSSGGFPGGKPGKLVRVPSTYTDDEAEAPSDTRVYREPRKKNARSRRMYIRRATSTLGPVAQSALMATELEDDGTGESKNRARLERVLSRPYRLVQIESHFDRSRMILDWSAFIVALAGAMMMVIDLAEGWRDRRLLASQCVDSASGLKYWYPTDKDANTGLRIIIFLSTVVLEIIIVLGYHLTFRIQRHLSPDLTFSKFLFQGGNGIMMLLEMIICIWHPIPYRLLGIEQDDNDNDVMLNEIGALMVLRFYLVLRIIRDSHPLYRRRRHVMSSEVYDTETFERFDTVFVMKLMYQQDPWVFVGIFFVSLILLFAYAIYLIERPYHCDLTFPLSIWFTLVTFTTVGYGDITPRTGIGRGLAVSTAIIGIVVASVLVGVVLEELRFTVQQRKAAIWLSNYRIERMKMKVAAGYVQSWWRGVLLKRQLYALQEQPEGMRLHKRAISHYRLRRENTRRHGEIYADGLRKLNVRMANAMSKAEDPVVARLVDKQTPMLLDLSHHVEGVERRMERMGTRLGSALNELASRLDSLRNEVADVSSSSHSESRSSVLSQRGGSASLKMMRNRVGELEKQLNDARILLEDEENRILKRGGDPFA